LGQLHDWVSDGIRRHRLSVSRRIDWRWNLIVLFLGDRSDNCNCFDLKDLTVTLTVVYFQQNSLEQS
jgi:hypothetical protein